MPKVENCYYSQNERKAQVEKLTKEMQRSMHKFSDQQNAAKEKGRIYVQTAKRNMSQHAESSADKMERYALS